MNSVFYLPMIDSCFGYFVNNSTSFINVKIKTFKEKFNKNYL